MTDPHLHQDHNMTVNPSQKVSIGLSEVNQSFIEREVEQRASIFGLPYANLLETALNTDALRLIPKEKAIQAKVAPMNFVSGRLSIGVLNPQNALTQALLDELKKAYSEVRVFLVSEASLEHAQRNYETSVREKDTYTISQDIDSYSYSELRDLWLRVPDLLREKSAEEVVNYMQELTLAMKLTDLHLEPQESGVLIRGRIDSVLQELCSLRPEAAVNIIRHIKHASALKLNVDNVPQDGSYSFSTSAGVTINVRVNSFPASHGESLVLRILDPRRAVLRVHELGLDPEIELQLKSIIRQSSGMLLVTGPTGSGKTTTLYSSLSDLVSPERKIITLEDPVEFRIPGILQSSIVEDDGYTFAQGLKSAMRQDPDTLLIGEIRDQNTAETAVQASLTGHMVFSTLHTNAAAEGIPRLLNMGVSPIVLAPSLRAILSQRLVRTLCSECKAPRPMPEEERVIYDEMLESLATQFRPKAPPSEIMSPIGCEACHQEGYRGVIAIGELLVLTPEIKELVFSEGSASQIHAIAREQGMRTLLENAFLAAMRGETTLTEVTRRVSSRDNLA